MSNRLRLVPLVTIAAGLVVLAGCQSGPGKSPSLVQGAGAAKAIDNAAATIFDTRQQVNRATASLRNLVDRPQDTVAQYKTALAEIAKLDKQVADVGETVDDMRKRGDAYLAEWARHVATIADPGLRQAAFGRRAETSERLQAIFARYQEVKTTYAPYLASLGEIQKVLGTDLSAKGLDMVKPFVAKASSDAEPLNSALAKLADEFSKTATQLKPGQ